MSSNIISSSPSPSAGKHHKHHHQQPPPLLLPGLPDHISQLCLSLVHPSILYSVCHSWRRLIYSPSFPPFLSIYTLLSRINSTESIHFSSFDPISSRWITLPPPPPLPGNQPLRLVIRHPMFMARHLSIQSVSVSGKLVVLAGSTDHLQPALHRPLIFDPASQQWSSGPPLAVPRRWCVAGAARGSLVVASGIGSHYRHDVARSVEKWDLQKFGSGNCSGGKRKRSSSISSGCESGWNWEKLGPMRDAKFSREAIDAVACRGKLCLVNVKGDFAKEGVVYDLGTEECEDMPEGMLAGWRGPAAAMDEETIYTVDESKGVLRKYDWRNDVWELVMESEKLRGAEQMTASGGRVCVFCSGGVEIVVVDVVASPPRLVVMKPPAGFQAVAVHILPRMSCPDLEFPTMSMK